MAPRSLTRETDLMETPCSKTRVTEERKENSALNCCTFAITAFALKPLMVIVKELRTEG